MVQNGGGSFYAKEGVGRAHVNLCKKNIPNFVF
jgi:hypothetical protein